MMPSDPAYYESLPKKRMGAGCLFFDAQGRVLLVRPTYKPVWEIPGGITELNEFPLHCCRREVQEELGLVRDIGDLLVVDYNRPAGARTESLMFIFSGGVLSAEEIAAIRLPSKELSEWRFFAPDALPPEMTPTLRARVSGCLPAGWRGWRLPGKPAPPAGLTFAALQVKLPCFADQVVAEFKVGFAFYQAEPGLFVNVARCTQNAVGP